MPDVSPVIVAVDQGTSSTKAIVLDRAGRLMTTRTTSIAQSHPRPGWVEQDPTEILESVADLLADLAVEFGGRIAGIGISTQRESALVWDRRTGKPLAPMLGWQDRRTSDDAERLLASGCGDAVLAASGLPIDPMFSALKFQRMLDEVDPDRVRSRAGEIAVGTVDAWLMFHLTGAHRIEAGNASRTQLVGLDSGQWDPALLELFRVPEQVLPEIASSDEPATVRGHLGLAAGLPVAAVLADSHAALYGHGVRSPGPVKATYGTGSSIMALAPAGVGAPPGIARTIAWRLGAETSYAFEGNILSTGATLVWLSGLLGRTPAELMALAEKVEPLHGVDLVPAFAGLAAPWWNDRAQAVIRGFTLGTDAATLARAAADSVALQIEDVVGALVEAGVPVDELLVDGGPSANDWLVQLQSDLSQRRVRRARIPELSAYGAAALAATTVGVDVTDEGPSADEFLPRLASEVAQRRRRAWRESVDSVLAAADQSQSITKEITNVR